MRGSSSAHSTCCAPRNLTHSSMTRELRRNTSRSSYCLCTVETKILTWNLHLGRPFSSTFFSFQDLLISIPLLCPIKFFCQSWPLCFAALVQFPSSFRDADNFLLRGTEDSRTSTKVHLHEASFDPSFFLELPLFREDSFFFHLFQRLSYSSLIFCKRLRPSAKLFLVILVSLCLAP